MSVVRPGTESRCGATSLSLADAVMSSGPTASPTVVDSGETTTPAPRPDASRSAGTCNWYCTVVVVTACAEAAGRTAAVVAASASERSFIGNLGWDRRGRGLDLGYRTTVRRTQNSERPWGCQARRNPTTRGASPSPQHARGVSDGQRPRVVPPRASAGRRHDSDVGSALGGELGRQRVAAAGDERRHRGVERPQPLKLLIANVPASVPPVTFGSKRSVLLSASVVSCCSGRSCRSPAEWRPSVFIDLTSTRTLLLVVSVVRPACRSSGRTA